MISNDKKTSLRRRRLRVTRAKLLASVLLTLAIVLLGYQYVGLLLIVVVWLVHELFWSERVFYDPSSNYCFNFDRTKGRGVVFEPTGARSVSFAGVPVNGKKQTILLEIELRSSPAGKIVDPYVVINAQQRQYFERGVDGRRYINLTHVLTGPGRDSMELKFWHCRNVEASGTVFSFSRPELAHRDIMIIAPHADDAEIAAFGLYSRYAANVVIVTVTAGETEAGYYRALAGNDQQASRIKGLLRSWDSVAVPQWGGLKQSQTVQLGYFCQTLAEMARDPEKPVSSLSSSLHDPGYFRKFNTIRLETDNAGVSIWSHLVSDLAELIERFEPDVVVTPHPCYDPHRDHYFASRALGEALEQARSPVETVLLYANHYRHTEAFPFGRSGSVVALPPEFGKHSIDERVFSFELDAERQGRKLLALAMMHDLRVPLSFKKRVRKRLQQLILGRDHCPYGDDDYLRKAVRANEIFFVCDQQQFKELTAGDVHGYL